MEPHHNQPRGPAAMRLQSFILKVRYLWQVFIKIALWGGGANLGSSGFLFFSLSLV